MDVRCERKGSRGANRRSRGPVLAATIAFALLFPGLPTSAQAASTLLSQGKPAVASSLETSSFPASNAFDGNTATRWASKEGVDPQWIYVDLGSTATIDHVTLNWEVAFAKSYQIQTSPDATTWTTIFSTTTGNGGIDDLTGLSGSGRFVRMFGTVRGTSFGYSLFEFQVFGTIGGGDTTPPSTPSNLAVTSKTASSVSLSWTASTDNVGVTGYEVFQGTSTTPVKTVTTTSATVTGLTASTTYSFTVKAFDAAGNRSAASNSVTVTTNATADTTPPTAPTGLTVTSKTDVSVSLSWTASTDNVGVTGYEIFQGSSTTPVKTVTTTSATVTGLTASTTYTFTVKAFDAAGNRSAASNSVTATTNAASCVPSSTAFVRLNQVGYDTSASKRAYLQSAGSESGATFTVVNSVTGAVALPSTAIGANLGSWSTGYPNVYALDFTSVTMAGTYTISVSGPAAACSPIFKIDTGASVYSGLLSDALFFFEAQRDGPSVISSVMNRKPAHLNDQSATVYNPPTYNSNDVLQGDLSSVSGAAKRDASGGWFDAGDYPKFVETHSYALDLLLLAVRDFPGQLGSGSSADFAAEGKFGIDWLKKMWDDSTQTLYYQVGIGEGNGCGTICADHDIWRLPEADDTFQSGNSAYRYIRNRPVFRAAAGGSLISPNLAGRMSGAFAECFLVYKASDPTYANQCLLAAEHIFDLANTSPGTLLTVSPFDFYGETEWRSDMELGATELYLAVASGGLPSGLPHTDPLFYLQTGAHWANAYITSPDDAADTLNLYDVSGLAHYELYKAITQAGNPSGLEVSKTGLLADIKKQVDKGVTQAANDPFGFAFDYAQFDAVSHGLGFSIMASEYDELSGTTTYRDFGRRQLGVILGANAWGSSFVVGAGTTFPHCMQHQVANLAGSLDGSPPVVRGAVVNGPNGLTASGTPSGGRACPANGIDVFAKFNGHGGQFKDDVGSWPTVEPAIDFSAATPLAFARQIAGLG